MNEQQVLDVKEKFRKLMGYAKEYIPERFELIYQMHTGFGSRILTAPASSIDYYHNAFPGGYIDHVLRVVEFSMNLYNFYVENGMSVKGFTKENLVFVAMHHDLGKLGFPGEGREKYLPNDSEWHRKNLGKVYKHNENIPFALVQDLSLYLLQKSGISMCFEEFLAIKIHDGLYDDTNKPYFISRTESAGLRSNLPYIVHTADLMASKHEYSMWKDSNNPETEKQEEESAVEFFKKIFEQ
jgi:hypothetical protein